MEFENLQAKLLDAVPEIQTQYVALQLQWAPDQIPNYIVFEDLFIPFIDERINKQGPVNGSIVHRAFQLIESMADSGDEETQNLVFIVLYEGREHAFLKRWIAKSLPATRALVERHSDDSGKTEA